MVHVPNKYANQYPLSAVGDGLTDDAPALNQAIQASADSVVQLEAGSVYRVDSALILDKPVTLLGAGAVIQSSTHNGPAVMIKSAGVILQSLRFVGPMAEEVLIPTTFPRSAAIEMLADRGVVENCRFEGYTNGGITVVANGCRVEGNRFVGVRHYRGDWLGVIYVVGNENLMTGNIIEEVWDAGIQIKGGCRNTVTGNTILCSRHENAVNSMGMRIMHGGQNNILSNNMVRYAQEEGISLAAPAEREVCGNIVTGNVLLDGKWAGIALAVRGGNVNRNLISHNSIRAIDNVLSNGIIFNTQNMPGQAAYNLIEGNMLYGEKTDGISQLKSGIRSYGPGVFGNKISGNRVVHVQEVGIDCVGADTLLSGNYIEDALIGIRASSCPGAMVIGNMVRGSRSASIRVQREVTGLLITGNSIDMEIALSTGIAAPRGFYVVEHSHVA